MKSSKGALAAGIASAVILLSLPACTADGIALLQRLFLGDEVTYEIINLPPSSQFPNGATQKVRITYDYFTDETKTTPIELPTPNYYSPVAANGGPAPAFSPPGSKDSGRHAGVQRTSMFVLNNYLKDSIMKFESGGPALLASIPLGQTGERVDVNAMDLSADGTRAYVTAYGRYSTRFMVTDPAQIIIVDLVSNTVAARIPMPARRRPQAVRATPDGSKIWVAVDTMNEADQLATGRAILIYDANTRSLDTTVTLPPTTFTSLYSFNQLMFTPDGGLAFIGTTREVNQLEILVIDTATLTVIHTLASGFYRGQGFVLDFNHVGEFAIDPRGESLYLAIGVEKFPNPDRLGLRIYDIASMTLKREIETPIETPSRVSLAIDSAERTVLLAPYNKPDIAIIRLSDGKVSVVKAREPRTEFYKAVSLN